MRSGVLPGFEKVSTAGKTTTCRENPSFSREFTEFFRTIVQFCNIHPSSNSCQRVYPDLPTPGIFVATATLQKHYKAIGLFESSGPLFGCYSGRDRRIRSGDIACSGLPLLAKTLHIAFGGTS